MEAVSQLEVWGERTTTTFSVRYTKYIYLERWTLPKIILYLTADIQQGLSLLPDSKKTPGSVPHWTFLFAILDNKHLLWKVSKESRAETTWAGSVQRRRGSCCQASFCLFYSAASSSPVFTNWCVALFCSLNAPCGVLAMHVYHRFSHTDGHTVSIK